MNEMKMHRPPRWDLAIVARVGAETAMLLNAPRPYRERSDIARRNCQIWAILPLHLLVIMMERDARESTKRISDDRVSLFVAHALLAGRSADLGSLGRSAPLAVQVQRTGFAHGAEVDRVQTVRKGRDDLVRAKVEYEQARYKCQKVISRNRKIRDAEAHRRRGITEQTPRDGRKPFVLLDLTSTALASQPAQLILDEQLADQALAERRDRCLFRKRNLVSQDVRERRVTRRALERRRGKLARQRARQESLNIMRSNNLQPRRNATHDHFIDEDAERPPIDGRGVTAPFDDLWRNVLFSTHERVCAQVGNAGPRIN